jgi:cyclophilin family peptidyl-prolyl cis-trans isomerase
VSSVSLTGTALAGATVDLYQGKSGEAPGSGTLITTTRAGTNGTFTFNNVTLAAGANSFVVRAVDAAGNLGATFAQTFTLTTPPTVANPVADQTAMAGGSNLTFDLSNVFETSESVVRMTLTYPTGQTANLDVNLFSTQAETTVNNFLAYVNASGAGNYNNSVFDRLVQGFVLQGGAFKFDSGTFSPITAMSAIASQPLVSNTIGTIAMALTGSANTATDAFFFNLADNSTNLDQQSGGFTVFGQVMENGLQTLATLNGLHTYSGSGQPGTGPIPVASGANTTNFPANITTSDLVTLTNVSQLTSAQQLSYSVVSVTGNDVVTAGVTGSTLTITPVSAGTAVVTVQATDLDGSTTQTQIHVTVS